MVNGMCVRGKASLRRPTPLLVLALVLVQAACTARAPDPANTAFPTDAARAPTALPASTPAAPDEYAVYSAVLAGMDRPPVLGDRTGGVAWRDGDFDRLRAQAVEVDRALWDAFNQTNQEKRTLEERSFPQAGELVLVKSDALAAFFMGRKPKDAWDAFHEQFPGRCVMGVSKVGFSDPGDRALVYATQACDEKSGRGEILYLVQKDGEWAVEGRSVVWGS